MDISEIALREEGGGESECVVANRCLPLRTETGRTEGCEREREREFVCKQDP